MPKLPGVNHLDAVRALEKWGFWIARQGKHIVMTDGSRVVTIPRHNPVTELWKGLRESRPGGTGMLGGRNPEYRATLLHQLHRRGRQAVCPCSAGALEHGKPSALAAGRGVSRRRKPHSQGQRTRPHDGNPTPMRKSVSEGAFQPQSQEEAPEGRLE